MPYKTGSWGFQAQERYSRRKKYYKDRYLQKIKEYHSQYKGKESLGYQGEELGLRVLIGSKKIMRPCDLSWEGKLVDVKTALPTFDKTVKNKWRWKFLLYRQKKQADLFLFVCKDKEEKVKYIYLIPNKDIKHNNLSFSENTVYKYDQYLLSL